MDVLFGPRGWSKRLVGQRVVSQRHGRPGHELFGHFIGSRIRLSDLGGTIDGGQVREMERHSGLRVDGTDLRGGLYGPPSKGYHGVCAINSETTALREVRGRTANAGGSEWCRQAPPLPEVGTDLFHEYKEDLPKKNTKETPSVHT